MNYTVFTGRSRRVTPHTDEQHRISGANAAENFPHGILLLMQTNFYCSIVTIEPVDGACLRTKIYMKLVRLFNEMSTILSNLRMRGFDFELAHIKPSFTTVRSPGLLDWMG